MMRRTFLMSSAAAVLAVTTACGGGVAENTAPPAAAVDAPVSQPATPQTSGVVKTVEPVNNAYAGHIDLFRWDAVESADGYQLHLAAATDGRTVWDSPRISDTEVRLPNTVGLEPEGYIWTVTAYKGEAVVATSGPVRFTVTP